MPMPARAGGLRRKGRQLVPTGRGAAPEGAAILRQRMDGRRRRAALTGRLQGVLFKMRTTKVKRLWPVMALAPLLALAAILAVSLWHNGPEGGLTPPAAEAQGRVIDPTPILYTEACAVSDYTEDVKCLTDEDSLRVSFTAVTPSNQALLVYVTGAAGSDNPGVTRYANMSAHDGTSALGKKGVAEYRFVYIVANAPGTYGEITVHRRWADDEGNVYLVAGLNVAAGNRPGAGATRVGNLGLADVSITRVSFLQDLALDNPNTVTGLLASDDVKLPARGVAATPVARRFEIGAAEADDDGGDTAGSIEFTVNPSSTAGDSVAQPGIGGRIEVVTTFDPDSALEENLGNPNTVTVPELSATAEAPGFDETPISATIDGWEATGAVKASVVITHIARNGTRTAFDPIAFYRVGPAASISVADPGPNDGTHRTQVSDEYGPILVQLEDALDHMVTANGQEIVIEGADDAAAAILDYDDEDDRTLTLNATADTDRDGDNDAYSVMIKIKDAATSGTYRVNLAIKEGEGDDEMTVHATPVTIQVIGAPDAMDGALSETTVNPTGNLMLTGVRFSAMGESAYTVPCHETQTMQPTSDTDVGSICEWEGKTPADRAVLENGTGTVNTNGTATIGVKESAAAGTYTLVITAGERSNSSGPVADKEIEFVVRGRPTMYTLTGPDQIGPGEIVEYSVKATDDAGGLPYLPADVQDVGVVLLGATEYVQTIHVTDGAVTLNALGEASFNVVAATDTPAGSNLIIAIAGVGADPVRKEVSIGPKALGVPTGLTLQTVADDTGTVTLSWTAGANSTRHWIAGIKQEDWDANDFSNVLFMEASSQTGHTFMDLEGGKVYVFTVTAGNAAGQWSDWAPLQRITVGTPAPTGGSGPSSPFGGN